MVELGLPAFTVAPASAADQRGPGLIVVHEGYGMTAQLIRVAERLARHGYRVIAPDFFSRADDHDPNDIRAIATSVTSEHLYGDLMAAADALRADGASSIGITGFCMGGAFSYRAALRADELGIAASVPFYGSGISRHHGRLQCPALIFFGGRDPYIPAHEVAQVRERHGDDVVVYPDAGHGFMRDGSDDYHSDAAADAWSRMLAFFDEHLS